MSEYDHEPIRGLPGDLPAGETLLWQGAPDWRRLARDAFHVRLVAGYFAVLLAWAVIDSISGSATSPIGIALTAALAAVCLGLLSGMAWLSARTTVYSITSKRVVMRFGIALPKAVNLPFSRIETAQLALNDDGTGDIALALNDKGLGYAAMWPHARAWKLARPEPSLRSLPDAAKTAALLAEACAAAVPGARLTVENAAPHGEFGGAVAA